MDPKLKLVLLWVFAALFAILVLIAILRLIPAA